MKSNCEMEIINCLRILPCTYFDIIADIYFFTEMIDVDGVLMEFLNIGGLKCGK